MQVVLIFWPGKPSQLGLWRPDQAEPWQSREITTLPGSTANHLMTALEELMVSQNLTIHQVTHIGVMAGPASYTELRSYVSAANAIAWARQLPMFAFTPTHTLPNDLPRLITQAKVNLPILPIYPQAIP